MISLPLDGSEELGLVLAASKLLDLLLVLETEEFQMFVVIIPGVGFELNDCHVIYQVPMDLHHGHRRRGVPP